MAIRWNIIEDDDRVYMEATVSVAGSEETARAYVDGRSWHALRSSGPFDGFNQYGERYKGFDYGNKNSRLGSGSGSTSEAAAEAAEVCLLEWKKKEEDRVGEDRKYNRKRASENALRKMEYQKFIDKRRRS